MIPSIVEHIERHLGRIAHGWSKDTEGSSFGFQLVQTADGALDGVASLATLGLGQYVLRAGHQEKEFRQELVILYREAEGYRNLPAVLQQLGVEALKSRRGYLRGEVIGPRGQLVVGGSAEAFYVAVPAYLEEDFHVFAPGNEEPITFAWLVPITIGEAAFIRREGWPAFEERLEEVDPDLFDFSRDSIAE